MEAVESFHAEHIDRPLRFESYAELRRQVTIVDLEGLPKAAGARFDPHRRLAWIEGYDLLKDKPAWVPLGTGPRRLSDSASGGVGLFFADIKRPCRRESFPGGADSRGF